MLKFFKVFILMLCLQAFLAQSEKDFETSCKIFEKFCGFSSSDCKTFSFSYEGTYCTNSTHVAVYFRTTSAAICNRKELMLFFIGMMEILKFHLDRLELRCLTTMEHYFLQKNRGRINQI